MSSHHNEIIQKDSSYGEAEIFPGTQGYTAAAKDLIPRYNAIPFASKYRTALHLLPQKPGLVLDVGAGTGADAAWFAARGHEVVAVEPTAAFRAAGKRLHSHLLIKWIDDGLPQLSTVVASGKRFDTLLLTAVWMHLDQGQRWSAMQTVAGLLCPAGILLMALRHGPVPIGRVMYEVSAKETIALANSAGLQLLLNTRTKSAQDMNHALAIEWTQLVFTPRAMIKKEWRGNSGCWPSAKTSPRPCGKMSSCSAGQKSPFPKQPSRFPPTDEAPESGQRDPGSKGSIPGDAENLCFPLDKTDHGCCSCKSDEKNKPVAGIECEKRPSTAMNNAPRPAAR